MNALSCYLIGTRCDLVELPPTFRLAGARFDRADLDLRMQDEAGTLVVLREFFAVESPPALRSGDGDVVPGDLARILVDLSDLAVSVLLAERDTHSASA